MSSTLPVVPAGTTYIRSVACTQICGPKRKQPIMVWKPTVNDLGLTSGIIVATLATNLFHILFLFLTKVWYNYDSFFITVLILHSSFLLLWLLSALTVVELVIHTKCIQNKYITYVNTNNSRNVKKENNKTRKSDWYHSHFGMMVYIFTRIPCNECKVERWGGERWCHALHLV